MIGKGSKLSRHKQAHKPVPPARAIRANAMEAGAPREGRFVGVLPYLNALRRNGRETVDVILEYSKDELLDLHDFGKKMPAEIFGVMDNIGYALPPPHPPLAEELSDTDD